MNDRGSTIHAVIWQQSGQDTPGPLVQALDRQGIRHARAAGPFEALSRVLHARRSGATGRVLVLVEPAGLAEQVNIRRALERYDPSARCWGYDSAQQPKLAPLAPPPKEDEPEVVVKPGGGLGKRQGGPPQLKLTGEQEGSDSTAGALGADSTVEPQESPRSLLTTEELEMLLADENGH